MTNLDEHTKLIAELDKVLTPKYREKLSRLLELEHELTINESK